MLLGVLFTVARFVLAQVLMQVRGFVSALGSPLLNIASAIIAVVMVFLFARIMTAKSLKGVDTKVQILGFQEFVNRVDSDRLKRMPPDTFEKFLPYAMALGIENRWAKAFQGIVQNQPNWYVGPMPTWRSIRCSSLSSMHAMATDAQQAFVAAPRASSTGSGWSGVATLVAATAGAPAAAVLAAAVAMPSEKQQIPNRVVGQTPAFNILLSASVTAMLPDRWWTGCRPAQARRVLPCRSDFP